MPMLPVIFLAFANDKDDNARYLRNLPRELDGIRNALYEAQEAGLCEVVERANITLEQIFDIFQSKRYENRIALFHYGGHADGYQLLLENYPTLLVAESPNSGLEEENNKRLLAMSIVGSSTTNSVQVAHGEGLVSFLAKQQSLKLVFFNGCSTQQQSSELAAAGVPCVIGTSNSISDDVATELSIRFYKSLGNGATIDSAWQEAIDYTKTKRGTANLRGLYRKSKEEVSVDSFPWQVFYKQGAETVKEWSLPIAVNRADYGLPPIPSHYTLPETPFLFLKRYEKSHARVFFGRTVFIRKLYEYALDRKSAPIMLLHGQSGVGKSSLLDAGLLPRLSQKAEVVYIRRTPELGLLGTLKQALGVSQKEIGFRLLAQIAAWFGQTVKQKFGQFTEEIKQIEGSKDVHANLSTEELQNLFVVWKNIEKRSAKPLVIILDQAEEVFTRPMPQNEQNQEEKKQSENEINAFLLTLKNLFGKQDDLPEGKLILSYRKEFHPEIEKAFEQYSLPKTKLFLEQLSVQDIAEVLHKFQEDKALQEKYFLQMQKELPEMLIQDLSSREGSPRIESPVAPVLQIILSKLWQNCPPTQGQRFFSLAAYRQLKSEGVEMKDFFLQQMKQLEKHLSNAVASGLVIDILQKHISQLGTAKSYSIEAVREQYQHRQTEIKQIITKLCEYSLLVEIWKKPISYTPQNFDFEEIKETILIHDTLAPIVQEEYNQSGKQGQRAARILKAKMADLASVSEEEQKQIFLDETDLRTVQSGKDGMSKWNDTEEALITKSIRRVERQQAVQKTIRRVGIAAVITILLTAIFAFYQMREAGKRATEASHALDKADSANAKNEKLISAFYFYDNKFTVASKKGLFVKFFYFIDKNGDKIEKLGQYTEASNFDYDGWAYISKDDNKEYLLDTLGNTYRVAYNLNDLSPEIEALDLRNKPENSFPAQALQFPNLKILLINGVKIIIPKQINHLQNLTFLKLAFCEVDTLISTFFELKSLATLYLYSNKLTTLPAQIGELKSLTTLDLEDNQLQGLPAQIGELKSLKILYLYNNKLMTLPAQIGELKSLTNLYLYNNKLTTLPAQIGELKSLTTLDLEDNQLQGLPAQIGELKNLKMLNLSYNQLPSLPAQIGNLKSLTTLDLSYNQLQGLPAQIGELKSLTTLDLEDNQLQSLPAQIGDLKSLTTLYLYNNKLTTLPAQIGDLKSLTTLYLYGNQLKELPIQIGELKSLITLDLRYNQLQGLPAEIGELNSLKTFDISNNPIPIAEIEKALARLPQIEKLYLGDLALSTLPAPVLSMKNLKKLDLSNSDDKKQRPNTFSPAEQEKIRKLLPACEVSF